MSSLPAGWIQMDLFSIGKEDYEVNDNPMVRKYGLTWNGARCGVSTHRARPCRFYDPKTGRCEKRDKEHWRLRQGEHDRRWDACGLYQPRTTEKCSWCGGQFDVRSKDAVRNGKRHFCSDKCLMEWLDMDPKQG